MKILLAENDKYRVFQTSKRRMVAESKPGVPKMRWGFTLVLPCTVQGAQNILKFLCPDKTTDAPAPDA